MMLDDELEDTVQEEVDKILWNLTAGNTYRTMYGLVWIKMLDGDDLEDAALGLYSLRRRRLISTCIGIPIINLRRSS